MFNKNDMLELIQEMFDCYKNEREAYGNTDFAKFYWQEYQSYCRFYERLTNTKLTVKNWKVAEV